MLEQLDWSLLLFLTTKLQRSSSHTHSVRTRISLLLYISDLKVREHFPDFGFEAISYCQAQVQVQVGRRSGEGQEGQTQVWVMWTQRLKQKLKDLDLSYTIKLVFTLHPTTTTNFFLGF